MSKKRIYLVLAFGGAIVPCIIHKAVGWMLREVGNREREIEEQFLKKNYQQMPRTMLRYAIEKLPEKSHQAYLKGKI